MGLILETMGSSGNRVSESHFITVEAAKKGEVEIHLKRKARKVLLVDVLCEKLLAYAAKRGIESGPIFLNKYGNPLSRQQIWRDMKALSEEAGVMPSKVYPHNLRHLFAVVFHSICSDTEMLADILGHSSVDTTRLYLKGTGEEHRKVLNQLGLCKYVNLNIRAKTSGE